MSAVETAQEHGSGSGEKGLKGGSLGLLSSVVVGIASTAPAYSLAASLGYVVVTENGDGIVGVKAPLIMVIAFVPMYFIAVAYAELNKAEPDCGTTFTWAARAFGTRAGWMGGWGIIAADVIVMANLAAIAGMSPSYFRGETLPMRHSAELLLVPGEGSVAHLGLPDSGEMPTVIAPDLSNLPPGQHAIDPRTGETRSRDDDG